MVRVDGDGTPTPGELIRRVLDQEWREYLEENWGEKFERDDALLTDHQRRFLLGLVEYSGENPRQQRYQIRKRIRRRFVDGIKDLEYLQALDDNSQEDIESHLESSGLTLRAADLLAFIYRVTGERNLIKKATEIAIYNAESDDPALGDANVSPGSVSVDINVEYPPDYEELEERYRERGLSGLQPEEIGYLVRDHRLDPEDLQRYYDGKQEVADSEIFDGVEYPEHPESFTNDLQDSDNKD